MQHARLNSQAIFAATLTAVLSLAGGVKGDDCCPYDQFWLISTRHIEEISCEELPEQAAVWRLEDSCWRRSCTADLVAWHDPTVVTLFYVHGNRYAFEDSLERGWEVYHRVRRSSEYCAHRNDAHVSIRYVIWSWPSDRLPGPLNDVRTKAERTDLEGLYLGAMLSQFPPDARISLMGYSFGTRVISGALHLVGGGRLEGRILPPEFLASRIPVRAALMAPAFQNTWLMPGSFHARALTQVDRMLVFYNPRDPVLRRYRLIAPGLGGQALGYTGLIGRDQLGPLGRRVDQIDVSDEVGRSHDQDRYLESSYFRLVRDYVLWRTWR